MWCQIGAPSSPQRCGRTSAGGNGELVLQLPSPNQAGQSAPRVYAEMCHQPLIVEQPRPLDQICLQLKLAWQLAYLLLRPLWATSHPMFLYQKEITVPFVQHHLRRCGRVCFQLPFRTSSLPILTRLLTLPTRWGNLWLSARTMRVDSCKIAPHFIGLFSIQRIINPVTIWFKFPTSMKIQPVFHVSQINPYTTSPLLLLGELPPPPLRITDGATPA